MDFPSFPLLCGRGGSMSIVFKTHYINIHNELADSVENSIIPYASICGVDEEHLTDGSSQLRRIHINLLCSRTKTIETNHSDNAEQILFNLLRNTIRNRSEDLSDITATI